MSEEKLVDSTDAQNAGELTADDAAALAAAEALKKEAKRQGAYEQDIPVSPRAAIESEDDLARVLEEHYQWIISVVNPRAFIGAGRANLSGADLRSFCLTGKNLSGANLEGANLAGMDLTGVNFTACNLRNADLRATILASTKFSRAKIEGAQFRGADLTGAAFDRNDVPFEELARLSRIEIEPREEAAARAELEDVVQANIEVDDSSADFILGDVNADGDSSSPSEL